MSAWGNDDFSLSRLHYIQIHISILLTILFFIFLSSYLWAWNMFKISYNIFDELIKKILQKKMVFFDTTPIGQILNLTSTDVDIMDTNLPNTNAIVLLAFFQIFWTFILVITGNFFLSIPLIVILWGIIYFFRLLFVSAVEIMKMKQLAHSPILSTFIELYSGLPLFRCFNKVDFIFKKYCYDVNQFTKYYYTMNYCLRFVSIVTRVLLASFISSSLFILVIGRQQGWSFVVDNKNVMAVTITMFLYLSINMHDFFYNTTESVVSMTSIQRLLQNVDDEDLEKSEGTVNPPQQWPVEGNIKAVNINLKYRKHLPFVLRGVSFDVLGGERIGIIGRTGSGKSSLFLGLMRILELEDDSGYFEIDGYKTNEMDLARLRKAICVIPQDPFLLKGSLQFNIDPYNLTTKEKVIEVLQKTNIWDSNLFYESKDNSQKGSSDYKESTLSEQSKLDFQIEDGGKNLSVGQRQLICIARAMLNQPKILLMDEATSNIDPNTDTKIQTLIRNEFAGSTILTIAHRIETIIDYDRLFVFEDGYLVEKGKMKELLNSESHFQKIIKEYEPGYLKKIQGLISQVQR